MRKCELLAGILNYFMLPGPVTSNARGCFDTNTFISLFYMYLNKGCLNHSRESSVNADRTIRDQPSKIFNAEKIFSSIFSVMFPRHLLEVGWLSETNIPKGKLAFFLYKPESKS